MDISQAEQPTVDCPHCQMSFTPDVWIIVDGDNRPDLLERVEANTLHLLRCPHCNYDVGHADAPLLLLRRDADVPLLFSPAIQTSNDEDQAAFNDLMARLRTALGAAWDEAWGQQVLRIRHSDLSAFLAGEDVIGNDEIPLISGLNRPVNADDWIAVWQILEAVPELLSDEANEALAQAINNANEQHNSDLANQFSRLG